MGLITLTFSYSYRALWFVLATLICATCLIACDGWGYDGFLSTYECPEGQAIAPDENGTYGGECQPVETIDAGPSMDAAVDAVVDAGPCGGGCASGVCDTSSNACVDCLANEDCESGRVCAANRCVECAQQSDCTAGFCVEEACIECRNNADCSGAAPICSASSTCVACETDEQCQSVSAGAVCDGTSGRCEECVVDADCGDATLAHCDRNVCRGCTESAQCERFPGLQVCDGGTGTCVECTSVDGSGCTSGLCREDNTCSQYGTSVQQCEVCDTDLNCAADHQCVPMQYMGIDRPGAYCLQVFSGAACPRPYREAIEGRMSLSGVSGARYCGVSEMLTTCEAVLDVRSGRACSTDADCLEGGVCRAVGVMGSVCTYTCAGDYQCPTDGAFTTCQPGSGGVTTSHCGS